MNKTTSKFIKLGAFMTALSVAFGAFGAHALKDILDADMSAVYNTAVEYQFYHSLGMFVIAFCAYINDNKNINTAGNIMFYSMLIFSGSLYIMTITGMKWLGAVTPIGGTGFILAWLMLASSFNSVEKDESK
jgi:uncharacterized membrane protein YgdD (TMEM256/DUF423 family)